jgi:hypothetical protein
MNLMSACVFHDVELKSLMDTRLSHEAIKALCDVDEAAVIPARYHKAVFAKNRPRLFSCNKGHNGDCGAWFEHNKAFALAALARREEGHLKGLSDDDQAVARRAVIFFVNGAQIGADTAKLNKELDDELAAELEEELRAKQARASK